MIIPPFPQAADPWTPSVPLLGRSSAPLSEALSAAELHLERPEKVPLPLEPQWREVETKGVETGDPFQTRDLKGTGIYTLGW